MSDFGSIKFIKDAGMFYKEGTTFKLHRNIAEKYIRFGYAVYGVQGWFEWRRIRKAH